MADYSPTMVNKMDVRNFFNPPLDHDLVPDAQLLIYIESVETYISVSYGVTGSTGRIPALLLIAAKIALSGSLGKDYMTLKKEVFDDYEYELASISSKSNSNQLTPYAIAKTWEEMAIDMLEKLTSSTKYGKLWVVNS